jgi:hypothetical protein
MQTSTAKEHDEEVQSVEQVDDESNQEKTSKQQTSTSNEESTDESVNSINTEQVNFKQMIERCTMERKGIEKAASEGQKKQAIEVNKGREWIGGERIPNNTICTLRLGRDRNKVGIKDLPVLVWKQVHYQKSGSTRYHLYSRVGILKGTYGREELESQPHLNASLMGIFIKDHEGEEPITALQAQEMYLKIGAHRSYCRCTGNCTTLKTCKCRKMKKVCTSRCHGKNPNLFCQLCTRQD